jgi:hypothetical protein
MKHEAEVVGVFDGIRSVPYAAPTSLLFQFARYDRYFNQAHMQSYFEAASNPKKVLWYSSGHDLNDPSTLVDRARWLEKTIGLKGAVKASLGTEP